MLIAVSLKVMPSCCGGVGTGRGKPIAPADGRCRLLGQHTA